MANLSREREQREQPAYPVLSLPLQKAVRKTCCPSPRLGTENMCCIITHTVQKKYNSTCKTRPEPPGPVTITSTVRTAETATALFHQTSSF